MAQIEAGLTDAIDAWGGEVVQLPPGPYQFKITAADIESKQADDNTTKLQLIVSFEVFSGEMAGKTAKSWFQIPSGGKSDDTARKRLKSLTLATGIQLDSKGNFDTAQLIGCKLNADVIQQSYESKPDPITGHTLTKTMTKIVNERPFAPIIANGAGAPQTKVNSGVPASMPGLPGLTKA